MKFSVFFVCLFKFTSASEITFPLSTLFWQEQQSWFQADVLHMRQDSLQLALQLTQLLVMYECALKTHGQRSLVGYSPWGCEESDTTEQLHFHFSLACIGEGNGNPLQYSCLENPRDGGAWWAAIYGVTQSQT